MQWKWLTREAVLAAHDAQLAEHGGQAGLRDDNLLESALARPRNVAQYEGGDHARLAAAYLYGIARNHPFFDGNKRAALVAAGMFLIVNGYELIASPQDAADVVLRVAEGSMKEGALEAWVRANSRERA